MIINGIPWGVRLVSPAHPMLLTPWKTHAYGACDKPTQTIYIDKTLNKSMIREVLRHELVHAYVFSYEVPMSYDEEELMAKFMADHGEKVIRHSEMIYNGIKMK